MQSAVYHFYALLYTIHKFNVQFASPQDRGNNERRFDGHIFGSNICLN